MGRRNTSVSEGKMECWRPLIAIAVAAGGDWPTKARSAALSLCQTADDDDASIREQLLAHIKEVFDEFG